MVQVLNIKPKTLYHLTMLCCRIINLRSTSDKSFITCHPANQAEIFVFSNAFARVQSLEMLVKQLSHEYNCVRTIVTDSWPTNESINSNRKYKFSNKYYTSKGIGLGNEVAKTHLMVNMLPNLIYILDMS